MVHPYLFDMLLEERKKERKKNYARTLYRHQCEPVVQMLNTAGRVVAWGVIPLLRDGLVLMESVSHAMFLHTHFSKGPAIF
jgi:hypothetical protein